MFSDSSALMLLVVGAYLVGSLSFAVIVSRVMGLDDPRTYGSQNPGATNVLRSGNKKAAIATLLFDALKGYFPVLLVKLYGPDFGLDDRAVALVAIAPSAKPQTSCAAKMLSGLRRKSSIETRPERQTSLRRRKASSRSSARDMSYFLSMRVGFCCCLSGFLF